MLSAAIFRVSAATVLLGVVGTSLIPYATSYVAISAVVNAPVVSIRAPFDGIFEVASGNFASHVVAGNQLVDLRNSVDQLGQVMTLSTSRNTLSGEISGIDAQIQAYID